jgi:hypothetical protein
LCCNQGKIEFELYKFLTENSEKAKYFRKYIHMFNAGMAMASMQVKDETIYQGAPATFKVSGQLYRRIEPMLASNVYDEGRPACLQIYHIIKETTDLCLSC